MPKTQIKLSDYLSGEQWKEVLELVEIEESNPRTWQAEWCTRHHLVLQIYDEDWNIVAEKKLTITSRLQEYIDQMNLAVYKDQVDFLESAGEALRKREGDKLHSALMEARRSRDKTSS
ncbi:uncharacterized protein IL334_006193 [Kwoniella shivajii]|uniref:Uncharacterized protein n=1 Tax=Kwoniella shivajii TaxID=564305 RepID=A0ABZ1D6V3_9TREE|nr:hypothetical protein IL334_006193 [Kwoniella shivajii]